jgi:hypothetical protein
MYLLYKYLTEYMHLVYKSQLLIYKRRVALQNDMSAEV